MLVVLSVVIVKVAPYGKYINAHSGFVCFVLFICLQLFLENDFVRFESELEIFFSHFIAPFFNSPLLLENNGCYKIIDWLILMLTNCKQLFLAIFAFELNHYIALFIIHLVINFHICNLSNVKHKQHFKIIL